MRQEGLPAIMTRWLSHVEEESPNLSVSDIMMFVNHCLTYELDEILDDVVNKHIPMLDEIQKHKLFVWARSKALDGAVQRKIIKLAVQERIVKLRHIVASEGMLFDGTYPLAVCKDRKIQEFLRGQEARLFLKSPQNFDYYYSRLHKYQWKVRSTCQFHLDDTKKCEQDPAFSVSVQVDESGTTLTKTADYLLFQQSLMEQRKEELAVLLLLAGPTKRVFGSGKNGTATVLSEEME